MRTILEWIQAYSENKLVLALTAALLGAILTKLLPTLWTAFLGVVMWIARRVSRRAADADFRGKYLDWVVTEQRELKLTGIVATDDAKKPTLEQVFVSLSVGRRRVEVHDGTGPDLLDGIDTHERLYELLDMHRGKLAASEIKKLRSSLSNVKPPSAWAGTGWSGDDDAVEEWARQHASVFDPGIVAEYRLRQIVRQDRAAILGGPGAGKSTLLQYLALTFARERTGDRHLRRKGILKQRLGRQTWRLPVVLRLSSVAHILTHSDMGHAPTLIEVIVRLLPPDLQTESAAAFFTLELQRGGCIVLLDGLDEVPGEEEFRKVVQTILSMTVAYRENQFIVTSRMAGWRTGLGESFGVSYVNDLTEAQIETFVDVWYDAVERNSVAGPLDREAGVERRARERRTEQRARELKQSLRENAGLRRLAVNPMLLSIIALVHRSLPQLPRDRSKLYAECSKLLLEQWDVSKGVRIDDTHLKLEQKEAIMRRLAIALHKGEIGAAEGSREARIEDVARVVGEVLPGLGRAAGEAEYLLNRLIERSGIIVERQRGVVAFGHHTFQEYFAAQWLARSDSPENCAYLVDERRLWSDWWREVILLYAGQISDCSELVRCIYEPRERNLFLPRLRLAVQCVNECVEMSDALLRQAIWEAVLAVRLRGESAHFTALKPEIVGYLATWSRGPEWNGHAAAAYCRRFEDDRQRIEDQLREALSSSNEEVQDAALFCVPYLDDDLIVALWHLFQSRAERIRRLLGTEAEVAIYAAVARREGTADNLEALLNASSIDGASIAIPVLRRMLIEDARPLQSMMRRALDWLIDATEREPTAMDLLRELFEKPMFREEILRISFGSVDGMVTLARLAPDKFQQALGVEDWRIVSAAFGRNLSHWRELVATGVPGVDVLVQSIGSAIQAGPDEQTATLLELLASSGRTPSRDVARAILRLAVHQDVDIASSAVGALPLLIGTPEEEAAGAALSRLCRHRSRVIRMAATRTAVTFVDRAPSSPLVTRVSAALRSADGVVCAMAAVGIATSSEGVQRRYYSSLVAGILLRPRFRHHISNLNRSGYAIEIAYALHAIAAIADDADVEQLFRAAVAKFDVIALPYEMDKSETAVFDQLRRWGLAAGWVAIQASVQLANRLPPHLVLSVVRLPMTISSEPLRRAILRSVVARIESAETVTSFVRDELASFDAEPEFVLSLFDSGKPTTASLIPEFLLHLGDTRPAVREGAWKCLVDRAPETIGIQRPAQ